MSRTDKTSPWDVRLRNSGCMFKEVHNHATAPCTLLPKTHKDAFLYDGKNCHYTASSQAWYVLKICGCTLCRSGILSGEYENRKSRRKDHIHSGIAKREANSHADDLGHLEEYE